MATLSLITPSKITAGESLEWLISLDDYPASEWTLSYALVNSAGRIAITGAQYQSGDTHHISVSTTTSAAYTAGVYSYQAYVSKTGAKKVVETGTIEVLPDFSTKSSGYDDRSFAKTCLDNIEAVLENRASAAQLEYTIAGRQLKFVPPGELLDLRNRFRAEYRAEEREKQRRNSGKSLFGQVQVKFSGAS